MTTTTTHNQAPAQPTPDNAPSFTAIAAPAVDPSMLSPKALEHAQALAERAHILVQIDSSRPAENRITNAVTAYFGPQTVSSDGSHVLTPAGLGPDATAEAASSKIAARVKLLDAARGYVSRELYGQDQAGKTTASDKYKNLKAKLAGSTEGGHGHAPEDQAQADVGKTPFSEQACRDLVTAFLDEEGVANKLTPAQTNALSQLVYRTTAHERVEADPSQSLTPASALSAKDAKAALKDIKKYTELAQTQIALNDSDRQKQVSGKYLRNAVATAAAVATTGMYRAGSFAERRAGSTRPEERRAKIALLGAAAAVALTGVKLALSLKGHDVSALPDMPTGEPTPTPSSTGNPGGSPNWAHSNPLANAFTMEGGSASTQPNAETGNAFPAPEHASSGYNPDYNPGSADSVTTAPAPEQSASGYNPDTATGLDSGDADETKTSGTGEVNDNNSGATNAAAERAAASTESNTPDTSDADTPAETNPDTTTAETDTDTGMTVEAIMEQTKDTVPTSFTVKSGDTLSEMSLTHLKQLQKEAGLEGDISMEQLTKYYELVAKSNGIDNPDLIHPGKVIKFGEADKALMSGIFEGVEAPKAETAAEEVAKQELPADIKAAAEKEASAAVEALQIPTPEELAKSLDASKFTNGQGLYDYFAKHGVPEAVRQDVMQAWLANDEIRALLTEGENPLMYIYEGTNGAELRLSAPHELTVSEQEVIVSAYKQVNPAVIAAEHQGFMAERAAKLLKIDDLDPDEYDLAA